MHSRSDCAVTREPFERAAGEEFSVLLLSGALEFSWPLSYPRATSDTQGRGLWPMITCISIKSTQGTASIGMGPLIVKNAAEMSAINDRVKELSWEILVSS